MATYTAVIVAADELSQDDVEQIIGRAGIVLFLGPGALVETGEDDEHGPTVVTGMDGMAVRVMVERTEDGPHVVLSGGSSCDLDGEMPGDYYLRPIPPRVAQWRERVRADLADLRQLRQSAQSMMSLRNPRGREIAKQIRQTEGRLSTARERLRAAEQAASLGRAAG